MTTDPIDRLLKIDAQSSLPGHADGLQASLAYSPEDWLRQATVTAKKLAQTGQPFTVDTIRREGVPDPDIPNRWGSLIASLAQTRVIEFHGLEIHTPKRGGPVPVRVWIGAK